MLMKRSRRLLPVTILALAGSVATAADSKPAIPKQIGFLPYKSAKKFDDPALGVALTYQGEGTTLNIYIYNGGVGDIPNGIDTVVALQQFEQAKGDVLASKAWTTIKFVSDGTVILGSKPNIKSYLALFEASAADTQYYSILYLTTGRNKFYKARLTAPKGNPILEPEPMAQLRRDLGDFIVGLIQR
jgi:hypothetical protein